MRQGRCTLPPGISGRVCDRLAGLEQVIGSAPRSAASSPDAAKHEPRGQLLRQRVYGVLLWNGQEGPNKNPLLTQALPIGLQSSTLLFAHGPC
jgi:hypothetical protein